MYVIVLPFTQHKQSANRSTLASPVFYLIGIYLIKNFVMCFIITILLLAADFYYLKNIAGRRLVGLRWWNEVDTQTGASQWVFESSDPAVKVINATDSRFFWLAMYVQPLFWVALGLVAVLKMEFIWLILVGRCRKKLPVLKDGAFD